MPLDMRSLYAYEHLSYPTVDLHSFARHALPYELGGALRRPEICIGTDDFHTPEELAAGAEALFRAAGLETVRNEPFAGAIVPGAFYRADPRVSSLMIEVRRNLYMDEATGERAAGLRRIAALIDSLAGFLADTLGGRLLRDHHP